MATVYSLVCWGGKNGKTVTMSVASPCVVSLTNHGLRDGTGVVFSTTGVLPTGVTAGTTYYAKSTAVNTFNLYIDSALTTIVNTSGSQSGAHTAKGVYYLGLADKSRWIQGSTELIFDGIKSWRDSRYSSLSTTPAPYSTEVCEIGEAFTEYAASTTISLNLSCGSIRIESKINGTRTTAFPNGSVSSGYCLSAGYTYYSILEVNKNYITIDGIRVQITSASTQAIVMTSPKSVIKNCVLVTAESYNTYGITLQTFASDILNNVIVGFGTGIKMAKYYCNACVVYNNLCAKGGTGFAGDFSGVYVYGLVYNNIAIGNTTNWGPGSSDLEGAGYNCGVSGDAPWNTGSSTAITTFSTTDAVDFTSYTNNNFYPYGASSKQVNAGTVVFGGIATDVKDAIRPNYESSSYPNNLWDAGPFEFDHGEGLAPASVPISITGMASGSEFAIYKASDMSQIVAPTSTTGAYSGIYTYTGDTNIIVWVRKGTASTKYLPYEYAGTITSTGFALVVSQVVDTIA